MKNQLVSVILVLLLVGVAVFVFLPGGGGAQDINGTATIYIEPSDQSSERISADLPISDATPTEQLLLSMSQPIRTAAFTPDYTQPISGIFKNSTYSLWCVLTLKVDGTNINSITSTIVQFKAYGAGYDPGITESIRFVTSTNALAPTFLITPVVLGQTMTYDQTTANADAGKFVNTQNFGQTGYPVTVGIKGSQLDGCAFKCYVKVVGAGPDGPVTVEKTAYMKITVTSWTTSQIVVSMFSMSGNTSAQSILPFATVSQEIQQAAMVKELEG
jgi:hypothetical protein